MMTNEGGAATAAPSPWRIFVYALQGKRHDLTSVSMRQAIILLGAPMMLEMFAQSLFSITSVFWVSRLGTEAVAVVGLTEAAMSLVYASAVGMSFAATAFVARRVGEGGESEAAERGAAQVLILGVCVSLLLGVSMWLFAGDLLRLLGAAPAIVEIGLGYAQVMFLGNITVFLMALLNAVLRGCGDSAGSMRTLWLANGVYIALAPCMIYGLGPLPELGLTGAAVATVLSRATGVAFQLWRVSAGHRRLRLRVRHFTPVIADMKRIAIMSWSGVAQMVISTTSGLGLFAIAAQSGTSALAGSTIAMRVVQFTMLPAVGLSFAAATLVGQNLGARRPDRAEEAIHISTRLNVIFLSSIGVLLFAFAGPTAALFADNAVVLHEATIAIRIVALGFPFFAASMCLEAAFNGAGDTWTPALLNGICLWILQIPLAWVLSIPFGFGTIGVFLSVPIAYTVLTLITAVLFKRGRWKSHVF